ncbi:pectinesterase family protein [Paenibacillus alkalitolerans]|uniref:pectinesterase family protein n=1 Tax=Paenibacillus alkalitolerans TaxID=2799335 RepID=UPI0018F67908|nr:pectinesterase family protein [Paenibacillus alkalitolerans]
MRKVFSLLLALSLFVSMIPAQAAEDTVASVPAFPGAEGGGMYTTGGRFGDVYEVTTLADSGAGSFRDAVSDSNRTVVFKVGGTIHLESPLKITGSNLTIAGQTAPGDGITVAGYPVTIDADNLIIRYMRFRLGDRNFTEADAFGGRYHKNIIIDHCSFSWSVDEVLSLYENENTTVQWSVISEAMLMTTHSKGRHGYGGIWGGVNATFHHNLFAHNLSRVPRFAGTNPLDIVESYNNVIYNWGILSAYGGEKGQFNLMNNYYKYGANTLRDMRNSVFADVNPESKIYINGNFMYGDPEVTADNWKGVRSIANPDARLDAPAVAQYPGNPEPAESAYEQVLAKAGAVLPKRDAIDARVVNDVKNGTGQYINSQREVGGYLEFETVVSNVPDDDHDGMPNEWELAHGLNPNDAADRNGVTAEGYTNLEIYLNSIVGNGSANPAVAITSPAYNSIVEEGSDVTITADTYDSDGHIVKVEFYRNDERLGEDTEAPYEFTWENVQDGTHYLIVKATDDTGTSTQSSNVAVHVNRTGETAPWASSDIGSPGVAGHTQLEGAPDRVTVKAAGDIAGTSDDFHFAYQTLTGNGEVVARVERITATDDGAEAGVMIRERLTGSSPMAAFFIRYVKGGMKSVLMTRTADGANAVTTEPEEFTDIPVWVKLIRIGDQFTALLSKDGAEWKVAGSQQIPMGETVYFGLAADASKADDDVNKYNTSFFTGAAVNALPADFPTAPTGVTAAGENKSVALTWNAVPVAESYNVKRSAVPGGPYAVVAEGVTGTSYTDTGLTAGQTYYYVVSAVNAHGESFLSAEVSAEPTGEAETIYLADDDFEGLPLNTLPEGYTSSIEDADHKVAVAEVPAGSVGNDSAQALIVYDAAPGNTQFIRKFTPQYGTFVVEADMMAERWPGTSAIMQLQNDTGTRRALSLEIRKPTQPVPETSYTFVYRDGSGDHKLVDTPPVNEWINVKAVVNVPSSTADIYVDHTLAADDIPLQNDMTSDGIGRLIAYMPGTGSGTMWYDNIKVYVEPVESPKGLIAMPGNGKVKLDWNAAAGAASYNVKRSEADGGPYTTVASGITDVSYIDETVTNGTTYYYVVTAVGPTGESGPSNQVIVTPSENAVKPEAPRGLQAKARSTQADLTWEAVEHAVSYSVKRGTDPQGPFTTVADKLTNTSYRDGGLTNGTEYFYVVSATSVAGEGDDSAPVGVKPYGTLSTPVITAEGGDGKIALRWEQAAGAHEYEVKRATDPEGPFVSIAQGVSDTEYTDTGVENGYPYYYRIVASNGVTYSLDSNIAAARPRAEDGTPQPPQLVKASPGDTEIELSWIASTGADKFKVKRSENVEGPYSVVSDVYGTSYTDSGLTNGNTYYYVVTAVNDAGESGSSIVVDESPATVFTVAADGSGMFATVQDAINAVPDNSEQQTIIKIKNGEYREKLNVPSSKRDIRMIGESREDTLLVYNDTASTPGPDGRPLGTSRSASVTVTADDFIAENLTIANDAGDNVGQAVALYARGERMEFRGVNLLGWQDTFYANDGRQYFVDSYIEGDVDFIFGRAAVVFDNCVIHSLSGGYVTAASTEKDRPGYVFLNSRITAEPGLEGRVALGRPWRPYSNVTFINSYMDGHIAATGWDNWGNPDNEATASYGEYNSYGAGANPQGRFSWSKQLTVEEAKLYTVERTLGGADGWNPVRPVRLLEAVKPNVSLTLDKTELWAPNHELVPIQATVVAEDDESGVAEIALLSIVSNEPDDGLGDGDMKNDIQGADYGTFDTEFELRAERSGTGNGRIYTIRYAVRDFAGNETIVEETVIVPLNQ